MRTKSSRIFTKNMISLNTFILFLSTLREKNPALKLLDKLGLNMKRHFSLFTTAFVVIHDLGTTVVDIGLFTSINQFEKDKNLSFDAVDAFQFVNYWKFQVSRSVQNVSELQSALLLKNKCSDNYHYDLL